MVGVEIHPRPGGLADVLEALRAEKMSVEYAYCFAELARSGAVDVLKVDDDAADKVLRGRGFRVLEPSDLYESD